MSTIDQKRTKLREYKLYIKKEKLKRHLASGKIKKPRTAQQEASELLSGTATKVDTSNVNAIESFMVNAGEGVTEVMRGLDMADQPSNAKRRFVEQLNEDRPISSTVGNIAGQVTPFIAPGAATSLAPQLGYRAILSGILGVAEGGIIARGLGGNKEETIQAEGFGGAIAAGIEVLFPYLGSASRSILRRLKRNPDNLVDKAGAPTLQFQQALDEAGVDFEDIKDFATEFNSKTNPQQAAILADFRSAGVPATKGDISQDFRQQAEESRLFGSTAEPLADKVRQFRLDQSNAFERSMKSMLPSNAQGENIGNAIKTALQSDKDVLTSTKNAFYKKAAENAEELGGIPIVVDKISGAIPSERLMARMSRNKNVDVDEFEDLLTEFGIANFEKSTERLGKQGVEPMALSLENVEEFRAAVNAMNRADQTGATAVMTKPVIDALDFELDNLAENVLASNKFNVSSVVDQLKKARKTVREIKTNFSPQSISGRLIDNKKDGFTPVVEASKVFNELVGTNKPPELLGRVISRLKIGGDKGQQAIKDLQAATVLDIIESAFKGRTRKVAGEEIFSPVAFNNRIAQIGDDRLKMIFGGDTPEFKKIKQMGRLASYMTPPNEAVPKGSASVLLDVFRKIGLASLSSKIPFIDVMMEGAKGLSESKTTRKIVDKAIDATPDLVEKQRAAIEHIAPSLAAALSIGISANELTEEPN